MLEWTARRVFDYRPPDDHPPPPVPPRGYWTARAGDGAILEAYRWGSPLGEPFVLEVRRYGAPRPRELGAELLEELELEPAELPGLRELQSATDQLVPLGVVLALGVVSGGPDATYPDVARFRAVRMIQAGALELAAGGRS